MQLVKLEQMDAEELGYQVGVSGKLPPPGDSSQSEIRSVTGHEVSHVL